VSAERRTLAPLGRRLATLTGAEPVGAYRLLRCADPAGPVPHPGQFYMLAAGERWGGGEDERPWLPRAFSHLRARGGELEFLLEEVGPGTRRLAELRAGDGMWLLGPLGAGFAPPGAGRMPLLVGGGIGIVPLACWQDELLASGGPAPALLGFRDAAHAEAAALLSDVRTATDDGSVGHPGLVTELLAARREEDEGVEVYACGPPAMLEAVRLIAAESGVPAQLALESGMACGFGACFGCVVPTRDGYVRLCVDGPVVEAAELAAVPAA
jgi:dihydroorotate dehydrogenase electron transfer subunit